MNFTPHQERALSLDTHLAVTANAGSGKTQVLVERYVRALLGGVPVGEVVALTYTEKAASALRRKIAERITGALAASADPAEIARLESIRDSLPSAFIGTIHGFCSRLLREYPVEAGVDAAFTMLESVDGELMLRECTAAVIGDIFRGLHDGIQRDPFMDLLRSMGRRRVLGVIDRLVGRPDLLERFASPGGVFTRPDDRILLMWEKSIHESVDRELGSAGLLADLEAIAVASSSRRAGEALDLLGRLRSGDGITVRAGAFLELAALMTTQAGDASKRFLGKGVDPAPLERNARRIARKRKLLDPLIDSLLTGSLDGLNRSLLRDARILLNLSLAVVDRYAARKDEDARLDFDDLQLKMRLLLGDASVRAELARRFRYVMVDEFQDTNTLQLEILLPLLQDLSSGNLMIVGDPKQSIYRFRDADVEVFDRSRSEIRAAAGETALVPLGESFRPLRDLVAFVNLLFGGLMQAGDGALYDPLVRARINDDPGSVEILLPLPEDQGGITQEELVARRILRLAGGGSVAYTREEEPRPLAFRDIALLLRSRTGLEEFEQAFIRNGVPYVVSGGVGYFQTQDVYDMYNYLRFLLDPSDDVALSGILRAPFFTVSDAELFGLARAREGRTLWTVLAAEPRRGREVPSLEYARRTLAGDIALATRLPAAELIARILRQTGFTAALAGTVRGAQAEANLGKLLEMARTYESQGFTSLYDFVGRLERLIEEEEKEGQAAIESQTDAVRIMTVHAAKGLEFPVVVVSGLQRQIRYDDEPYIDASLGIGLDGGEGSVTAPLAELLKERAKRKAVEEEQRILYVACTRARDRLILSSDAEGREDSWLGWLGRMCEDHGQALAEGELRFDVVTGLYDGSGTSTRAHQLVVPVTRTLPAFDAVTQSPDARRSEPRVDISPIVPASRGEIFSASRIRTFVECPAKYFFRYVLGVPSGGGPFIPGTGEEFSDGDYPAELRGRVFHAVMENAVEMAPGASALDAAVLAAIAKEAPFTAAGYPSLTGDVAGLVRGVLDSAAWKEIAAGSDVRTEFSISAALGPDFITGTIDRLYRGADGLWTVLDYKTDAVAAGQILPRAESYWPQLEFYALMVRRLCDAPSVRIRLLFAHHPESDLQKVLGPDDLLRQEDHVARIIERIKTGQFPPSHPPCQGCPMHPGECRPG